MPKTKSGFGIYGFALGKRLQRDDTYYNDIDMQEPRQRFTIAHEIKHVVSGDCHKKFLTVKDEALADFFAKSLLAPQAIIIQEGLSSPDEYVKRFLISKQSAEFYYLATEKRKYKFGETFLFDYEREFLEKVKNADNT